MKKKILVFFVFLFFLIFLFSDQNHKNDYSSDKVEEDKVIHEVLDDINRSVNKLINDESEEDIVLEDLLDFRHLYYLVPFNLILSLLFFCIPPYFIKLKRRKEDGNGFYKDAFSLHDYGWHFGMGSMNFFLEISSKYFKKKWSVDSLEKLPPSVNSFDSFKEFSWNFYYLMVSFFVVAFFVFDFFILPILSYFCFLFFASFEKKDKKIKEFFDHHFSLKDVFFVSWKRKIYFSSISSFFISLLTFSSFLFLATLIYFFGFPFTKKEVNLKYICENGDEFYLN